MTWYLMLGFVGVALGAFICRSVFFGIPAHVELPPRVVRALKYAPLCALTAIIAPYVFAPDHTHLELTFSNHRIIAAAAAVGVYYWRRSMALMTVVGLLVFTALRLAG